MINWDSKWIFGENLTYYLTDQFIKIGKIIQGYPKYIQQRYVFDVGQQTEKCQPIYFLMKRIFCSK